MAPTTPADASDQWMSRLTMALLEDSGWYLGNWSAATYLPWGRKAGCEFALMTSSAYAAKYPGSSTTPQQNYFCTPSNTAIGMDSCTYDGRSHGRCIKEGFSTSGLVSTYSTREGYVQSSCQSPYYTNSGESPELEARATIAYGWAIGTDARCLQVTRALISAKPPIALNNNSMPFCWNVTCLTLSPVAPSTASTTALLYEFRGRTKVTCTRAGQVVDVAEVTGGLVTGQITCPNDFDAICRILDCPSTGPACVSSITSGGTCFEGQCVCRHGFVGSACQTSLLPLNPAQIPVPPSPPPKAQFPSPPYPSLPPPFKVSSPPSYPASASSPPNVITPSPSPHDVASSLSPPTYSSTVSPASPHLPPPDSPPKDFLPGYNYPPWVDAHPTEFPLYSFPPENSFPFFPDFPSTPDLPPTTDLPPYDLPPNDFPQNNLPPNNVTDSDPLFNTPPPYVV